MDDLSLYVLDITMNSVRAGADTISVSVTEDADTVSFTVRDNGCGMSEEQLKRLRDPFFTTRKTRKVGLGIPLLTMLADMTGGGVSITSKTRDASESHGTVVTATFGSQHIDFIPIGDMKETFLTLIQGSPDIRFTFTHERPGGSVRLSTDELRAVLGDLSLAEPEILAWIRGYLEEQYEQTKK